jgi:hypothetical protein
VGIHRPDIHQGRNTHVVPGMTEKQARMARMLDAPTVVVVLLVIPALILHFSNLGGLIGVVSTVLNWFIYGWFAFEFICMLYLTPSDREYFKHNKLDLFVLLTTIPILPAPFQALGCCGSCDSSTCCRLSWGVLAPSHCFLTPSSSRS